MIYKFMNDVLTYSFRGDLRGRVVVRSAATAHLTIRQRQSERAVFSLQLFAALAEPCACSLEVFVRGKVRLDHRTGLVLCDCAFEFFYSSFQRGDLVGFGLGRHI